ncbi:hypothetical protein FIBSPDRAFT_933252 [Athelia psychrophila]|uniref:Uncharacterized protein n=1 Tax=Athelia psychrophila TaxID=1759441 RepID=A0A166HAS3_9AGAM|nr:hypothetical protein FIBSPDRAFT_933252 [Fibularhizoctonia sp. CBS 109695]
MHLCPPPVRTSKRLQINENPDTSQQQNLHENFPSTYATYCREFYLIQSERFRQTGVTENSLLSPDELLRIIFPHVPPGIFDFMDSRITMTEEVEWPDLEAIYGNQCVMRVGKLIYNTFTPLFIYLAEDDLSAAQL